MCAHIYTYIYIYIYMYTCTQARAQHRAHIHNRNHGHVLAILAIAIVAAAVITRRRASSWQQSRFRGVTCSPACVWGAPRQLSRRQGRGAALLPQPAQRLLAPPCSKQPAELGARECDASEVRLPRGCGFGRGAVTLPFGAFASLPIRKVRSRIGKLHDADASRLPEVARTRTRGSLPRALPRAFGRPRASRAISCYTAITAIIAITAITAILLYCYTAILLYCYNVSQLASPSLLLSLPCINTAILNGYTIITIM